MLGADWLGDGQWVMAATTTDEDGSRRAIAFVLPVLLRIKSPCLAISIIIIILRRALVYLVPSTYYCTVLYYALLGSHVMHSWALCRSKYQCG